MFFLCLLLRLNTIRNTRLPAKAENTELLKTKFVGNKSEEQYDYGVHRIGTNPDILKRLKNEIPDLINPGTVYSIPSNFPGK